MCGFFTLFWKFLAILGERDFWNRILSSFLWKVSVSFKYTIPARQAGVYEHAKVRSSELPRHHEKNGITRDLKTHP